MRKVGGLVIFTAVAAAVVTAAALILVVTLRRWHSADAPQADLPAASAAAAGTGCGDGPCRVLATQNVNGVSVQLLADPNGGNARLQAGPYVVEATVSVLGARVDAGSLSCVSASVSACLISAAQNGGKIAQLVVDRGGVWRADDRPYFSSAGIVGLTDLVGSDAPEVVVVQSAPVLARVYSLDGSVVGCTSHYSSVTAIRGWPNVHLVPSDLRPCSG